MPSRLVPKKFKEGRLHSGSKSGPIVTNRKQMEAIMLSEKKNEQAHGGVYMDRDESPQRTRLKKPSRRKS